MHGMPARFSRFSSALEIQDVPLYYFLQRALRTTNNLKMLVDTFLKSKEQLTR